MPKSFIAIFSLLFLALIGSAQAQIIPHDAGIRYSEEISNVIVGTTGSCGCFALEGVAADANWKLGPLARMLHLSLAADAGVESTSNANGAGYGLTLTTFTAGPRFTLPAVRKTQVFAQALAGVAHGSNSNFPQGVGVVSQTANSYALDFGGGVDHQLNKRLSLRLLQLDFLRTAFPNNSNNWQNNLRISAGITLRIGR
jgi:hypothetical protein